MSLTIIAPFVAALALCAAGSIWPIRLDHRALQDQSKLQSLPIPHSSGNFLFLSGDNSIESARTATFGLRQQAFPDGSVFWAALKERCTGPWSSGFVAVDSSGDTYRIAGGAGGDWQWQPVEHPSEEARQRVAQSYIIFDSSSTRAAFEQRWPFLKEGARVTVLSEAPSHSPDATRSVAGEFTLTRIARIAAVIGSYAATVFLLLQFSSLRRSGKWFIYAGAVFLALGLNLWLSYLLQWIFAPAVKWTPAILWIGLLWAAWLVKRKSGPATRDLPSNATRRLSRTARMALIYSLSVYALIFLARLDFDGDFFNNWLPQGRFHYLLGRHDPAAIINQGSMQAASYPPGYGIALSMLMWMTDMEPAASFLAGTETSFAILLYRLLIFALNAALFLLLAMYLSKQDHASLDTGLWLATLMLTMLLIPSTAGKHVASETLLFPVLAAAIVLVVAGQKLDAQGLTTLGLGIGGMATIIKWEATIIFAFAVVPWLVLSFRPQASRPSRSLIIKWALIVLIAFIPTLVWKATLNMQNEFFVPVTWSRFVSSAHLLPGLLLRAARIMFEDGRLVFLVLALPCAVAFQLRRSPHWTTVVVPLCLVVLFAGWVVIFLFSNIHPHIYLETSYPRLVMVPVFSAIVYCVNALHSQKAYRQEAAGAA